MASTCTYPGRQGEACNWEHDGTCTYCGRRHPRARGKH